MHISNVNSSELKCRQNFNLCHAGGLFTLKDGVGVRKKEKEKEKRKKKNPKQLLKYQDEKPAFNIKV